MNQFDLINHISIELYEEVIKLLGKEREIINDSQWIHKRDIDKQFTYYNLISPQLGSNILDWGYIIQTKFKNEELGKKFFNILRPQLSINKLELSSDDIYDAIQYYINKKTNNNKYNFSFYFPIAASNYIHIKSLKNTLKHGFIINTSPLAKESNVDCGVHWVAFFVELDEQKKQINLEYFDSMGSTPNDNVKRTLQFITTLLERDFPNYSLPYENKKIVIYFSRNRLQQSSTECGVFCIHYIITRMKGKNYMDFLLSKPTDDYCKDILRKKYFYIVR